MSLPDLKDLPNSADVLACSFPISSVRSLVSEVDVEISPDASAVFSISSLTAPAILTITSPFSTNRSLRSLSKPSSISSPSPPTDLISSVISFILFLSSSILAC